MHHYNLCFCPNNSLQVHIHWAMYSHIKTDILYNYKAMLFYVDTCGWSFLCHGTRAMYCCVDITWLQVCVACIRYMFLYLAAVLRLHTCMQVQIYNKLVGRYSRSLNAYRHLLECLCLMAGTDNYMHYILHNKGIPAACRAWTLCSFYVIWNVIINIHQILDSPWMLIKLHIFSVHSLYLTLQELVSKVQIYHGKFV